MFRNVGGKIRVFAIIFFSLLCVASLFILAGGIISGITLGWAWPIIGGVAGAAAAFVFNLFFTYLLFGYGTLVKSCEENARINAEILALLRKNAQVCSPVKPVQSDKPAQPVQPVQPVQPIQPFEAALPAESVTVEEIEAATEAVTEKTVEECEAVNDMTKAEEVETEAIEPEAAEIPEPADVRETSSFDDPFVEELFSDKDDEKTLVLPKNDEQLVKRCPSCGNVVRPQANFCNQCGQKMK